MKLQERSTEGLRQWHWSVITDKKSRGEQSPRRSGRFGARMQPVRINKHEENKVALIKMISPLGLFAGQRRNRLRFHSDSGQ